MKSAKTLASTLAAAGALSLVSLCLLLVATPPYQCGGVDYQSPATPVHSGAVALGCFLYAIVGLLVGFGLRLGVGRDAPATVWVNRALVAATLTLLMAGAAVFADLGRWTCWP